MQEKPKPLPVAYVNKAYFKDKNRWKKIAR